MASTFLFPRNSTLSLAALFLTCLLALYSRAGVMAQEIAEETMPTDFAPLMLDGEKVLQLAGSRSFPAAERIAGVRNRLIELANNPDLGAIEITAEKKDDDRVTLRMSDRFLLTLYPVDADAEGIPMDALTELAVKQLTSAIRGYRDRRQPEHLLKAAGKSIGALAIVALLIAAARFLFSRLSGFIDRRYRKRVQDLKIESFEVVRAENIWKAVTGTLFVVRNGLILVAAYLAIEFVLYQFPWTRGTAASLLDLLISPLQNIGSAFVDYLPSLVFLIILLIIARYLIKLMHLFFQSIERKRVKIAGFEPEWAPPTYKLLRFFLILLTAVLAYPYIPGSGSAAFQGLSILLGIMVSLGASSAVSSVVAGYAMTYRKAFREGDLIKVGEHMGVVVATRLLVTHLKTAHNEEVVLPNATILSSPITNLSRPAGEKGLILHTSVGIGYETPWRQVEAMLIEAALKTEGMKQEPAPFVLEKSLGDFGITYELNAYAYNSGSLPKQYARLHRNILDVFNHYGVAIMTPAYISDPDEPKLVREENWYTPPAKREEK